MIAEALRKTPLFAELDEDELARVVEMATIEEKDAGEVLFTCGEPSTHFYVLLDGKVEIRIPASQVQDERRIPIEPGSFFGEMGVLRGKARMADASVLEDARVVAIEQGEFDELMAVETGFSEKVMRAFLDRAAQARASECAADEALEDPRSLLFLGTGDGVGTSFLVANLAAKIRDLTGKGVLAVDFRVDAPALHRYLGVRESRQGLESLCAGLVDPLTIRQAALQLEEGVDLLSNTEPGGAAPSPEALQRLVPAMLEAYHYVVIDALADDSETMRELARLSHTSQIVLAAKESSVQRARELGEHLKREGLDGRIRFLLNRHEEGVGLSVETLEFELGEELTGKVSEARGVVSPALDAGVPVVRRSPRSAAAVQISRLARQLLSLPTGMMEKLRSLASWSLFP